MRNSVIPHVDTRYDPVDFVALGKDSPDRVQMQEERERGRPVSIQVTGHECSCQSLVLCSPFANGSSEWRV